MPAFAITSPSSASTPANGPVRPNPLIEQYTSAGFIARRGRRSRYPAASAAPGPMDLDDDVDAAHEPVRARPGRTPCRGSNPMLRFPRLQQQVHGLAPTGIAVERLDPDHVGAEVGEDHRCHRSGQTLAEIENSQTGARPGHRRHSPVVVQAADLDGARLVVRQLVDVGGVAPHDPLDLARGRAGSLEDLAAQLVVHRPAARRVREVGTPHDVVDADVVAVRRARSRRRCRRR